MRSAGSSRCRRRWPDAGSRCRPYTAGTKSGLLMPVAYMPGGRSRHPASWGTGDPRTRSPRCHQIRRPCLDRARSSAPVPRPGVSAHTAHATTGSRMRVADISLAVTGPRVAGPGVAGPGSPVAQAGLPPGSVTLAVFSVAAPDMPAMGISTVNWCWGGLPAGLAPASRLRDIREGAALSRTAPRRPEAVACCLRLRRAVRAPRLRGPDPQDLGPCFEHVCILAHAHVEQRRGQEEVRGRERRRDRHVLHVADAVSYTHLRAHETRHDL